MTTWLTSRRRVGDPAVRVYCFPHAGGSTGEYLRWSDSLPDRLQLWGVNLPGRGVRLDEPPLTDVADLVESIVDHVVFTPPFVLFGHSFGALLAYEVAQRLRTRDREQPELLVLSGSPPPHVPRTAPRVSDLPEDAFLDAIRSRYGAETADLLADPDLRDLALPGFRADLAALERYAWPAHPPLDRPLAVLSGDDDPLAGDADALAEWGRHTTAGCRVRLLKGGHFYFRDDQRATTEALADLVEPYR